jgi:hypothetical protein
MLNRDPDNNYAVVENFHDAQVTSVCVLIRHIYHYHAREMEKLDGGWDCTKTKIFGNMDIVRHAMGLPRNWEGFLKEKLNEVLKSRSDSDKVEFELLVNKVKRMCNL